MKYLLILLMLMCVGCGGEVVETVTDPNTIPYNPPPILVERVPYRADYELTRLELERQMFAVWLEGHPEYPVKFYEHSGRLQYIGATIRTLEGSYVGNKTPDAFEVWAWEYVKKFLDDEARYGFYWDTYNHTYPGTSIEENMRLRAENQLRKEEFLKDKLIIVNIDNASSMGHGSYYLGYRNKKESK